MLLNIVPTSAPTGEPVRVTALNQSNDVHITRAQTPFIITAEAKKIESN